MMTLAIVFTCQFNKNVCWVRLNIALTFWINLPNIKGPFFTSILCMRQRNLKSVKIPLISEKQGRCYKRSHRAQKITFTALLLTSMSVRSGENDCWNSQSTLDPRRNYARSPLTLWMMITMQNDCICAC